MSDGKPVVFVVDDDFSVRESLAFLLESANLQPETFGSAQEFLSNGRVRTPNCLVLDVHLPDLSGLDLQALVCDRTDMPIIFITGQGDVPMTVQAMKAGAIEFLTKPFSDTVLLKAVAIRPRPESRCAKGGRRDARPCGPSTRRSAGGNAKSWSWSRPAC